MRFWCFACQEWFKDPKHFSDCPRLNPKDIATRHQKAESLKREVLTLKETNPYLSRRQIGRQLGVSGERVGQILRNAGIKGPLPRPKKNCSNLGCTIRIPVSGNVYCSPQCRKADALVAVECHYCGKSKQITRGVQNRSKGPSPSAKRYTGKFFCNKRCQGKWLGSTHGFKGVDKPQPKEQNTTEAPFPPAASGVTHIG